MINRDINKYISDLLCEHNCVVIPQFGGFVANYSSARIDVNTNYMSAPKKSIVFNKSLQNNDGLLVNEIALCQGLTFKQAQKILKEYVLNLNESLKLYKKVYIDDVGSLLLTDENSLLFVQSDTRNHLLDSYGFNTIQYPKINRYTFKNELEGKIKSLDKTQTNYNKKRWLKVAAVMLPLIMLSAVSISNKDSLHNAYANLLPLIPKTSSHSESFSPNLSDYEVYSPTQNISGALSKFYVSKLERNITAENALLNNMQSFIVAGAFSSIINAEKLVSKLKTDGYSNAKIIGQSHSGLHRVAYSSYSDISKAMIDLKLIRKDNSSAWLLK
ncbi:MAG: SPOR domain-containing protein [Bacteroidota bacterium]|nr:SPOR domain-containing protein [Bacteroidota bacterium]